jgi:thiamine-monophosphate kinase
VNEFELISRYFTRTPPPGSLVAAGVGDDCALLDAGAQQLAVTTDMLVEGRHFVAGCDPEALGHKALAVNLSDLAAAGSAPRCFFLALALPTADEAWLTAFARGLLALADRHGCVLAGGDTTRTPRIQTQPGPLTICVTAIGSVPRGAALTRGGARAGDDIYVSNTVGDAALALAAQAHAQAGARAVELDFVDAAAVQARLDRPEPRVALGQALRGVASACIDVSDGLVGDLAHIGERSNVGARLDWAAVPRSPALRRQALEVQQRCALAGGDDYELLFTAPAAARKRVQAAAAQAGVTVVRIGEVIAQPGIAVVDEHGHALAGRFAAYDHFG